MKKVFQLLNGTVVLVSFVFFSTPSLLHAQIEWDNPGAASYTNANSWVGGEVPGPGDNVDVLNGGTVLVETADPAWTINRFFLGDDTGTSGSLTVNGGTLNVTDTAWAASRVGAQIGSTGTLTVTSGTLQSEGAIGIGYGGTGHMALSGGSVIMNSTLQIGNRNVAGGASYGSVTHSGGLLDGTVLVVGRGFESTNPTESGLYTLSGTGEVNVQRAYVSDAGGSGRVEMAGGTFTASDFFVRGQRG